MSDCPSIEEITAHQWDGARDVLVRVVDYLSGDLLRELVTELRPGGPWEPLTGLRREQRAVLLDRCARACARAAGAPVWPIPRDLLDPAPDDASGLADGGNPQPEV